jgi:hypothetical protein
MCKVELTVQQIYKLQQLTLTFELDCVAEIAVHRGLVTPVYIARINNREYLWSNKCNKWAELPPTV